MSNESSLKCPKCGQARIAKVSGIYSVGKSFGRTPIYDSEYGSRYGDSQSFLSLKLAPPSKPKEGCFNLIGCVASLLVASIGSFLSCSSLLLIILNGNSDSPGSLGTEFWKGALAFSICVFPIAVLGVVGVLQFYYGGIKVERKRIAIATPIWEKALERWNKLYYCEVCDGVFDLEVGEFVPIDKMKEYLYR